MGNAFTCWAILIFKTEHCSQQKLVKKLPLVLYFEGTASQFLKRQRHPLQHEGVEHPEDKWNPTEQSSQKVHLQPQCKVQWDNRWSLTTLSEDRRWRTGLTGLCPSKHWLLVFIKDFKSLSSLRAVIKLNELTVSLKSNQYPSITYKILTFDEETV